MWLEETLSELAAPTALLVTEAPFVTEPILILPADVTLLVDVFMAVCLRAYVDLPLLGSGETALPTVF